jgi:hypothetical protein
VLELPAPGPRGLAGDLAEAGADGLIAPASMAAALEADTVSCRSCTRTTRRAIRLRPSAPAAARRAAAWTAPGAGRLPSTSERAGGPAVALSAPSHGPKGIGPLHRPERVRRGAVAVRGGRARPAAQHCPPTRSSAGRRSGWR